MIKKGSREYKKWKRVADVIGCVVILSLSVMLFVWAYITPEGDPSAIAFGVLMLFIGICCCISSRVRDMASRFNIHYKPDDDEEPYG